MRCGVVYLLILCYLNEAVHTLYTGCPALALRNGKVKKRQRGRFVKFICNTGYMLAGERFSTCSRGIWDPVPPKCVRPTCMNKASHPINGLIYPTHSGAALHIYCKPGYEIRGPTEVYCDGRKWDNNMPTCLKANTKPKLYCDFEEEDLCGWTHDLNHDFDWKRENHGTPSGSIGTGPSFDHTKGRGQDGYYMYIESSSRNENDTARLISPIFDKTDSETCLEFFYHMFGLSIGTLRVYVKKISQSWNLDPNTAVFSMHGNQGDRWYRSYHSLGAIDEEYQIIIEGIRGNSYVSDIAIDDVKIIENCIFEEITTTTEEYSTAPLLAVESCEGRCGETAWENETHIIPCDCDDNCYDHNKCCPDYFDFCFAGTTIDDIATSDVPVETTEILPHMSVVTSQNPPWTIKPVATKSTPTSTTTRKATAATSTTTTRRPTTRLPFTAPTSRPTTKKVINKAAPTLRFLTRPTHPTIMRKVLPIRPITSTTSKVMVKPKKTNKTKQVDSNDVMDVPEPTNSDEELLLTSPLPNINVKKGWRSKEDEEDLLDSPVLGNVSEKDKFFSVKGPVSTGYNVVLVVISVLGIAILTTVIAIVLIRRYKGVRRRMRSSNGDSQSDVRFLTSDQVLDFSLDKDYDSL